MTYTEAYYTTGNYQNYLDRGERYRKIVEEIDLLLDSISIKKRTFPILDFGCGVGHIVRGLKDCGYSRVEGYDISEWAVDKGNASTQILYEDNLLTTNREAVCRAHYITYALDVFEHMDVSEVKRTLRDLNTHFLIVRIPVAEIDDGPMILSTAESDPTHITKLTKRSWGDIFSECGYDLFFLFNLKTIWNSKGVLSAMYIKK